VLYQTTRAYGFKIKNLKIDLEMSDACNSNAQLRINSLANTKNKMQNYIDQLTIDLGVSRETVKVLNEKNTRLTEIIKTLRSRNKVYSMGATRFVNPETDIRVIQVYAREELAIALQKDGIITYKVEEKHRDDLDKDTVTVTATINVNKIKP